MAAMILLTRALAEGVGERAGDSQALVPPTGDGGRSTHYHVECPLRTEGTVVLTLPL